MNLSQFEKTINGLFQKEMLEEFDDDYGFTNTTNNSIMKVGYSTNLTIETVEKAAENNVDLLITHHDAWDFIYGLRDECIKKLVEHNISHFWIHGPLDYVKFGTCTSLMKIICIDNIRQYSFYNNGDIPGIGELDKSVNFNILVDRMRSELNEPVRSTRRK